MAATPGPGGFNPYTGLPQKRRRTPFGATPGPGGYVPVDPSGNEIPFGSYYPGDPEAWAAADAPGLSVDPGWTSGIQYAGGAGGGGGSDPIPSVEQILATDQQYQALMRALMGQSAADRSTLKAARQRAYILFGADPGFGNTGLTGDWAGDIDATTRAAAEEANRSGVSTTARLKSAHDDALQAIKRSLIQRGAYESGELGYNQGREGQQYTIAQFDAKQKLLDYLAGIQASYTTAERQRQLQELAAQQQAYEQWLAMHPDAGTGGGGNSGLSVGPGWTSGIQYGGGGLTVDPGWLSGVLYG